MVYIAFLRGINVGERTVKMEHLRALFTRLGCTNVRSYIQSGNIFFETVEKQSIESFSEAIGKQLLTSLGFPVTVCLRTIPEIEHIIALDPFKNIPLTPDLRFCVVFIKQHISYDTFPLVSPKGDLEIIGATKHEAFVVWHIINGRPPTVAFQEKMLGKDTTSRFYHTLIKILEAAKM